MYLAVKLSKFEVKDWANRLPNHHNWWDQFVEDLDTSDLEEICHQVCINLTKKIFFINCFTEFLNFFSGFGFVYSTCDGY